MTNNLYEIIELENDLYDIMETKKRGAEEENKIISFSSSDPILLFSTISYRSFSYSMMSYKLSLIN